MSRLLEASLTFPLPKARTEVRLNVCSFSNVHKHYLQCECVCCGGTLPQHFKFGKADGVPDEHCEINGFH